MKNNCTFETWQHLLNEGTALLREASCAEAAEDARLLLLTMLDWDFGTWLWNRDREPDAAHIEQYLDWIHQRVLGNPVQYITGIQCFMGLDFQVSPDVLIPRSDTEVLVETILGREKSYLSSQDSLLQGMDLCTGSGCIAVSLNSFEPRIHMTCTDISDQALQIAAQNAAVLLPETASSLVFRSGNLFEALHADDGPFDFLVSNPPYIASSEVLTLDPLVKDHEPLLALDGGSDGLNFYRIIAQNASGHLKTRGRLYLEIGDDQGKSVPEILKQYGWHDIEVFQDLAGLDRVVCAVRC